MNRRTIHPIAPWLIAGVLLISGGIVFRVWAQQVTALTTSAVSSDGAAADDLGQNFPRLGSKFIQPSLDGTLADDSEQASKIAASPSISTGSSSAKPVGDPDSVRARTGPEPANVASAPTPAPGEEGAQPAVSDPASDPEPESGGGAPAPGEQAEANDDALFVLLRDALSAATPEVSVAQPEPPPTPVPTPEPRLLRANQVLQIVYVEWMLEEKLTPLLTQAAAQRDVTAMLAALRESHAGYRLVHLVGFAPRVDLAAPPNSPPRPEPVLWLTYSVEGIERIDWSAPPARIARTLFDYAEHLRIENGHLENGRIENGRIEAGRTDVIQPQ